MTITARFGGKCSSCGQRFEVGDQIDWSRGGKSIHTVCPAAAAVTVQATPQAQAMTNGDTFQRIDGEGWSDLGMRALLYTLTQDEYSTWKLDDEALEAAADACSTAATLRGLGTDVVEMLTKLQPRLRNLVAGRKADAAAAQAIRQLVTGMQPTATPAASQPPSTGKGGGGGSKVKRPTPKPQPPTGGHAVPVLVPVPPLAMAADDLF